MEEEGLTGINQGHANMQDKTWYNVDLTAQDNRPFEKKNDLQLVFTFCAIFLTDAMCLKN